MDKKIPPMRQKNNDVMPLSQSGDIKMIDVEMGTTLQEVSEEKIKEIEAKIKKKTDDEKGLFPEAHGQKLDGAPQLQERYNRMMDNKGDKHIGKYFVSK